MFRKVIEIRSESRSQMLDITPQVEGVLREAGVEEGTCLVYVPHTTAGVTINENADPTVREDILEKLEELVPRGRGYRHLEGNADSHIKATLVGSSVTIPVSGGRLLLGTWQGIFFCEFDGPRRRRAIVQVF